MKGLVTYAVLFISGTLFAQAPYWDWAIGAGSTSSVDRTYAVCSDQYGCTYTTGTFSSPSIIFGGTTLINAGWGADLFIVKSDPFGNILWAKRAGGYDSDCGTNLAVDAAGNCYITGYFTSYTIAFDNTVLTNACSSGCNGFFVAKYDPAGNVVWAKTTAAGIAAGNGIAVDQNNNVFVTGYYISQDVTFGSTTLDYAWNGPYQYGDIFVVKYDSNGNVVWARGAGADYTDKGNSVGVDAMGNCYVTGTFASDLFSFGSIAVSNPVHNQEIFIAKYDAGGNVIWVDHTGTPNNNYSNDIVTDPNGNSYITGTSGGGTLNFDTISLTNNGGMFIVKYNSAGNALWAKVEANSSCWGNAVSLDAVGSAYVAGWFSGNSLSFGNSGIVSSGGADVLVLKYDTNGNEVWALGGGGSDFDGGYGIACSPQGKLSVTGCYYSFVAALGPHVLVSSDTSSNYSDIFIAQIDNILAVEESTSINSVALFPNPSSGQFAAELNNVISRVEVTDIVGNVVYADEPQSRTTYIDLEDQANGIYFVKVFSEHESFTQKIAIQK